MTYLYLKSSIFSKTKSKLGRCVRISKPFINKSILALTEARINVDFHLSTILSYLTLQYTSGLNVPCDLSNLIPIHSRLRKCTIKPRGLNTNTNLKRSHTNVCPLSTTCSAFRSLNKLVGSIGEGSFLRGWCPMIC